MIEMKMLNKLRVSPKIPRLLSESLTEAEEAFSSQIRFKVIQFFSRLKDVSVLLHSV